MVRLITESIDNGITILAAALLLRYYFKPEAKRLYKKKWVLACCSIMILYSIVELGVVYREHIGSQLPTPESIVNTMQDSGQIVTQNFIFSSEDGYQILIPAGYKYISSDAGGLSLAVTSEYSAILVAKIQDSADLDSILNDALVAMRGRNSTFTLNDRRKISIAGSEAVRINYNITRNNIPTTQIMALYRKSGSSIFQLTFTCSQDSFDELNPQYEKVLSSFKIN